MRDLILNHLEKQGLIVAFALVAVVTWASVMVSARMFRNRIPGSALAIFSGLVLAWIGGMETGGNKGIADISLFSGMGLLGGTMFRDFAVVATAAGARSEEIRKAGKGGIISLFIGVVITFFFGAAIAWAMGYRDAPSLATIGAGACTFIVGPVTGTAVGAASPVIAISIATGVLKSILVTILTPLLAKRIGLDNPGSAMVFGGMMGTTSGVAAGLGATDPKLVPYGALTATFYTGLGCLLCPSVLYLALKLVVGG
ncbi:MAG: malonate transporter subunit MadM [Bacteroidota bacterium]